MRQLCRTVSCQSVTRLLGWVAILMWLEVSVGSTSLVQASIALSYHGSEPQSVE